MTPTFLQIDAAATWISEQYPNLFGAVLLFAIGATVGIMLYRHHHRIKDCENKFGVLNGIKESVDKITTVLVLTQPETASAFVVKNSPRQLNENGRKLFDILKGDKFFEENSEELLSKLGNKKINSALDVEQGALAVLLESVGDQSFKLIKDIIYVYPAIEIETPDGLSKYEFTLNDAIFVLSLRLRDMYLERHPEITILEEGD